MKSRFTTVDICAIITELRESLLGMRVANVYDIDNKTYLIRLGKTDTKVMLLIESGNRINTTDFEWPKNMMPSGFSMKCRKHIRSRRLVNITQLGVDRIVDLQFGSDEAAYHLIVELYDRGNVVLTDFEYTILSLLRTRTDTEDVRFAVREKYPIHSARQREPMMNQERLGEILAECKEGTELKKILNPHFVYGAALIEHCLIEEGFPGNVKTGAEFDIDHDLPRVMAALKRADSFLDIALTEKCKGVIVQKREKKPSSMATDKGTQDELLTYQEFYPFLLEQHKKGPYIEFPSFDKAVDEFFSKMEGQKIDLKALSQEKTALKKLENVRNDHQRRIEQLQKNQDLDMLKAELVELNLELVDKAILIVNSAIANQIDWSEINSIVKEAQAQCDQVACAIGGLKLETNHITMNLRNPYDFSDSDSDFDEEEDDKKTKKKKKKKGPKFTKVDINLALSAYANARSFYDKKKFSSKKEQKTIDASEKALKSAERKTKETLKEVETTTRIKKARKTYWFEKFFWFISSENYLVIGGRDQQQNELVVKRHLEQGDLYVHADLHGATSVVIKNPTGQPVPPKTLNEAGCMAVSYSAAWEAKIVTSAWWVHQSQVSKTAPTPCYLMMGFGFMFKLDETCIENHLNERRVRTVEDTESVGDTEVEEEISVQDEDSDREDNDQKSSAVQQTTHQEEDEDAEASLFPDTSIDLQLTREGKIQLQPGTSRSSSRRDSEDGVGAPLEENKQIASKQRLSAKQRRDNRKNAKQSGGDSLAEVDDQDENTEDRRGDPQENKAKLKKIKEKYGEQDEEERQMKMEILASAGPAKESKADKRKKEKKGNRAGGANRPVSGKPNNRNTQSTSAQSEQNKGLLDPENNGQATEVLGKTSENERDFPDHAASDLGNNGQASEVLGKTSENERDLTDHASSANRESGLIENSNKSKINDYERTNEGEASLEKPSKEGDEKNLSSAAEHAIKEKDNAGVVKTEGTQLSFTELGFTMNNVYDGTTTSVNENDHIMVSIQSYVVP
ncbi:unnamed protein product [Porites evermanni]|uniref:NFACT RNA-binding domain-containing protein n=1 Tax=Porites evermanni TaxID=104178 RepID=A0ABN8PT95_9CNID|nr:unnamed protein product [Porites evermanni]